MHTGMAQASIQAMIPGAALPDSLSKPTMKPAFTKIPALWMLSMLSTNERLVFCFFCMATSVSASGLSIPTKTAKKLALLRSCISGTSSERFTDASVLSSKGKRCLTCQSIRWGRNLRSAFLLPIRLSSTKST